MITCTYVTYVNWFEILLTLTTTRLGFTKAVVSSFGTLMAAHRGEVVCVVTTAKELDAANKKEVEGALAGFLKSGEKALISYSVDASIVGGMVVSWTFELYLTNVDIFSQLLVYDLVFFQVSIADKFVDMSMASKLTKYSELIKGAA